MATGSRYAVIRRGSKKRKDEFRWDLYADNGTHISSSKQYYSNNEDVWDVLREYFPAFEIRDESGVKKRGRPFNDPQQPSEMMDQS